MKRIKYYLGCLALALLMGCNKSDYHTNCIDLKKLAYDPNGFVCTATKEVPGLGSIEWNANVIAAIRNDQLHFVFLTYLDTIDWYIREDLFIGHLPLIAERSVLHGSDYYQLHPGSPLGNYSRSLSDGDVLDAFWTIDESMDNYVNITLLDLENRRVEGEFDVHFFIKTQGATEEYSEQINFKSGRFKAEIME